MLRIDEFPFRNPLLDGAFIDGAWRTDDKPSVMVLRPDLPPHARRAREIEGHGHDKRPPITGRKLCYTCFTVEDLDYMSVSAVRRVVDQMAPEWVEAVRDAVRLFNRADMIQGWLKGIWDIELQVIEAILLNLEARGELPQDIGDIP